MAIKLVHIQPTDNDSKQSTLKSKFKSLYIIFICCIIYTSVKFVYNRTGGLTGDPNTLTYAQTKHSVGTNQRELEYYDTVVKGYKTMSQSKIIVVGLIRDSYTKLQHTIDHLYSTTLPHFADYRIVLVENDSTDNTKQYIAQLQEYDSKFIAVTRDNIYNDPMIYGAFSDHRFEIMSKLRNEYLQYIHTNYAELQDFSQVMILDFDIYQGWSVDGLAHTYGLKYRTGHTDRYDIVCGNGVFNNGQHYDTLAYRDSVYTDTRHMDQQRDRAHKRYELYSKPFEVTSCFGGMALYDTKLLIQSQCMYNNTDCEHVTLNDCLRSTVNAHIHLNPNMLLWYGVSVDKFLVQYKLFTVFGLVLPIVLILAYVYVNYKHYILNVLISLLNMKRPGTPKTVLQVYRQLSDVPEEHIIDHSV